jgi:hypothetical protein
MRKHNGMRPQDIVLLLKIISKGDQFWQNKDLAKELIISPSEISESLGRSIIAGLYEPKTKRVHRNNIMEFIEHGLHYVFPAIPAMMANGIPTAHSHPFMKRLFQSEMDYVWLNPGGKFWGLSIEPLYKELPNAALLDEELYKMLALIDVIRVGRVREWKVAISELKKMIL